MKQFVLNSEPDKNGRIRFEGGDYRYLARVRRLAPGEYFPVLLPDRASGVLVRVLSVDKNVLIGEISDEKPVQNETSVSKNRPIILFQSLPKGEKMDLIVRQAAEGGIEQIVPFMSEFSAVKNIGGHKFTRWERIIKEARQQSGSPTPTVIRQPLSIDGLFAFWEELKAQNPGVLGLLFHHLPLEPQPSPQGVEPSYQRYAVRGSPLEPQPSPKGEGSPLEKASLHGYLYKEPEAVALAIGPEGGFSPSEAQRFMASGFKAITIGETILRTETAALYAQAAVRILLLERDSWEMK
jgi:16S rRNA (uracil1498-N3)-methyltransferase